MTADGALARLAAARTDPAKVVLEGLHPLKHALRFGAEIDVALTSDASAVLEVAQRLAPDGVDWLRRHLVTVEPGGFRAAAPPRLAVPVIAVARRPAAAVPADAVAVLLEAPASLGNLGAVIRAAAGLGAGAVLVTGRLDPWSPAALRGSAGLHFALPVAWVDAPPAERPLVLLDPEGEPMRPGMLPADAVLAFGTERDGLSPELRNRPHRRLGIPLRPGVSSLNLATAVAITLWTWRLGLSPSSAPR